MKNGYIVFWNGQRKEVYANTTFEAQQEATKLFQATAGRKKVKSWDISVNLAELNGETYTQTPDF